MDDSSLLVLGKRLSAGVGRTGVLAVLLAAVLFSGTAIAEPVPNSSALSAQLQADKSFALVMTNGYGDVYRMNKMRERQSYQAYRGICSYRGFSLSGCSTTGEVVMLRIKATPSMPEHFSLLSTSLRWGQTMYVLNDVFHPLNSSVMAGYENWYPFDMSCSVAMYINSGGLGLAGAPLYTAPDLTAGTAFGMMRTEDRGALFAGFGAAAPQKSFSLVMTNGYGDVYRMNKMRERQSYQAYRGICSYRGFSLSGCSTTGEVVMLRIKATPSTPEHFSLVSTSLRWGTTMYFLNDVFRPLNSWTMAGYENWYPFDMSCSVAMYINAGGLGARAVRTEPVTAAGQSKPLIFHDAGGTNLVGALLPLTGDLADVGCSFQAALAQALEAVNAVPGMPPTRLLVADTRTDVATAYEKLAELRSNGCHVVLGPASSEECRILKTYANENDVLLISSSATAASLALPGDNLMRLAPDDAHQARALADLLAADGISDIMILSRSDIYGAGFTAALIGEHNARGGAVFATNYLPRASALIPEVISNIVDSVSRRAALKGAHRVGVVTVVFDEGVEVLRAAAEHPDLDRVRWYGCDGMAQNNVLTDDAAAAAFAARTRYVCSIQEHYTNTLYAEVSEDIRLATGQEAVRPYALSGYDSLGLVAEALRRTGGVQSMAELIAEIRSVASNYSGCTGPIVFDAADDRACGSYDFYEVEQTDGCCDWVNLRGKVPGAPGNLAASQGAYADRIKVVWNSVSGAQSYELWGASVSRPTPIKLQDVDDTECWVLDVPQDQVCYFQVRAVGAAGAGAGSAVAEGWARSSSGPEIAVNGSRAAAFLATTDPVWLTIALEPGQFAGVEADWWLLAEAPGGWYFCDAQGEWRPALGGAVAPRWQHSLVSLPPTLVLSSGGLAVGEYNFYFGVDARDGVLDPAATWLAEVNLRVE